MKNKPNKRFNYYSKNFNWAMIITSPNPIAVATKDEKVE